MTRLDGVAQQVAVGAPQRIVVAVDGGDPFPHLESAHHRLGHGALEQVIEQLGQVDR